TALICVPGPPDLPTWAFLCLVWARFESKPTKKRAPTYCGVDVCLRPPAVRLPGTWHRCRRGRRGSVRPTLLPRCLRLGLRDVEQNFLCVPVNSASRSSYV